MTDREIRQIDRIEKTNRKTDIETEKTDIETEKTDIQTETEKTDKQTIDRDLEVRICASLNIIKKN